jgi:hypothetical protein
MWLTDSLGIGRKGGVKKREPLAGAVVVTEQASGVGCGLIHQRALAQDASRVRQNLFLSQYGYSVYAVIFYVDDGSVR